MHSWSQMMLTSRHSSTSRKIQTMSALWCRDKIDIMNSWAYLSPLLTNNNARLYRECVRPCVLCAQTCLTLRDPMNCGPPGSSVCGISQARILQWVAIFLLGTEPEFPASPALAGGSFTAAHLYCGYYLSGSPTPPCILVSPEPKPLSPSIKSFE